MAVPMLPVPQEHAVSLAARRQVNTPSYSLAGTVSHRQSRIFYHKTLAPSSDIDLFLFGLDEQQALEKIKEIEFCVRSNSLEQTTVR